MNTLDLDNIPALRERALQAENENDKLLADVLHALADSYERIDALEDTETLEQWANKNGDAEAYKQFFYDCFEHLDGHYPCPSIGSDYDKSIIFDAIERGEDSGPIDTLKFISEIREAKVLALLSDSELLTECIALATNEVDE